jgi:hypothetical protein
VFGATETWSGASVGPSGTAGLESGLAGGPASVPATGAATGADGESDEDCERLGAEIAKTSASNAKAQTAHPAMRLPESLPLSERASRFQKSSDLMELSPRVRLRGDWRPLNLQASTMRQKFGQDKPKQLKQTFVMASEARVRGRRCLESVSSTPRGSSLGQLREARAAPGSNCR